MDRPGQISGFDRTQRENMRSTVDLVPLSDWRKQGEERRKDIVRRVSEDLGQAPGRDEDKCDQNILASPVPQRRLYTPMRERGRRATVTQCLQDADEDKKAGVQSSLVQLFHHLSSQDSIAEGSQRPGMHDMKG